MLLIGDGGRRCIRHGCLAALLHSKSHRTFKMPAFYHHQKGRLISLKMPILEKNKISRCRYSACWCLIRLLICLLIPPVLTKWETKFIFIFTKLWPRKFSLPHCYVFLILWLLLFCCSFRGGIGSQCLSKCASEGVAGAVQQSDLGVKPSPTCILHLGISFSLELRASPSVFVVRVTHISCMLRT